MPKTAPSRVLQMVDLKTQYSAIKDEVDAAIQQVVRSAQFIKGPQVEGFEHDLAEYLGVPHVIACANGTDALQIAMMALGLEAGDEVIVPSFTYVATAEAVALLGLVPVMVDVDPQTFNVRTEDLRGAVTDRTRAIVPVHLFGQSVDMEPLLEFTQAHNLYVVEDNAQAIGANYTFTDGRRAKTGSMGDIGCTSFFPSKNLGCYGDGGAIFTNDDALAEKIRMVANHGQRITYYHDVIGVNSRLDAVQAAVLRVKLPLLDEYNRRRRTAADFYDRAFSSVAELQTPTRFRGSDHVFHQYVLRVNNGRRDQLKAYLADKGIPHNVYYPVPLYKQPAYQLWVSKDFSLPHTELLCSEVIALPMHTELDNDQLTYITDVVREFFG